jgi:hypothetical protein
MNFILLALALAAPAEITVTFLEGPVAVLPAGGGAEQAPAVGATLHEGDTVQTQAGGRIEIELPAGSIIRLGEGSKLRLTAAQPEKVFSARLFLGNLWTKVHKLVAGETFQLETENGVAGVRGTEFRLEAAAGQPDTLRVYEGIVQVDDRRVESGHELRFRRGEKAEPRPFDAKSERGHKFMDWVRTRPMKDGKEPGAIHHPDRNPERENRTREKHERKH